MTTTATAPTLTDFERVLLHTVISPGQTIVDVSVDGGEWLRSVKSTHANISAPFNILPAEMQSAAGEVARSAPCGFALSNFEFDLDGATQAAGVRQIHFLRIAEARQVRRILTGAGRLLRHSRVDFIQFPLDTWDIWTGQAVSKLLVANYYNLYTLELNPEGAASLVRISSWDPTGKHRVISVIAVHERLLTTISRQLPSEWIFDPYTWAQRQGLTLKGIIHVGANDGSREIESYEQSGFRPCLMIEANPVVFKRLTEACQGKPDFILANNAVLDRVGAVPFHVTDNDQSSSILKLGTHLENYPSIAEERTIEVEGITLDELLRTRNLDPSQFNVMNVDIQGAELLAFRGAKETLKHIDLLLTEVEFEELYKGCSQVDELDDYLAQFGLRRIFTASCHQSWAEAIYTKVDLRSRTLPGLPSFLSAPS